MVDVDEYERAARFLQDFHRPLLSLYVIVEEEEEQEGDAAEALITGQEKSNTGSLSKMQASMCLSSLALSSENGNYEDGEDDSLLFESNIGNDYEEFMLPLDDCCSSSSSSSSWGQFIASDDAFVRVPSSPSSLSPVYKTSSSSLASSNSVRSGCNHFGSYRHYRHNATKSRIATK